MWSCMRSRGNATRLAVERALRGLALVVLAFAAWNATRPPFDGGPVRAGNAELGTSLPQWTAVAPPRVDLSLDIAPSAQERDWLRALRRAGSPVAWVGDAIPAVAL